jgi:hypothetical protein
MNQPNISTNSDQNFHEKWVTKTLFRLKNDRLQDHVPITILVDLQVIPNSGTEIALKEQVYPILMTP